MGSSELVVPVIINGFNWYVFLMAIEKIITEHSLLKARLNKLAFNYYVLDEPLVSDEEYDSQFKRLLTLEASYPELDRRDSPTIRVGGEPLSCFNKVTHKKRMLSISNIYKDNEIDKFFALKKNSSVYLDLKYDGLAISLIYQQGFLIRATTRGDGNIGEDVTENVKTIRNIPLKIDFLQDLEVRGEILIAKKDLAKLNASNSFSNLRNAAAGSIRQLDPKVCSQRPLQFYPYSLLGHDELTTHADKMNFIHKQGFSAPIKAKNCNTLGEVKSFIDEVLKYRDSFPVEIDGVVLKINDLDVQRSLGYIARSPKYVAAYKFPAKEVITTIKGVDFQVGRTGNITPVAKLNTVDYFGVMISSATLHNFSEVKRLGIKINDQVVIKRAGDVIPAVVRVVTELRIGNEVELELPSSCPSCGTELIHHSDTIIRCPNHFKCQPQVIGKISHYCSRNALNIVGLADKLISKLADHELVSDPFDLYFLTMDDLLSLDGFKKQLSSKLLDRISNSLECDLAKFIFALGINEVGAVTAKNIANIYDSLEQLEKLTVAELEEIDGIGSIVAENIVEFFHSHYYQSIKKKINQIPFVFKTSAPRTSDLVGNIYVVTGKFNTRSRAEITDILLKNGAKVSSSVSSKTTALICGLEPGSKLSKAEKLQIPILREENLFDTIPQLKAE